MKHSITLTAIAAIVATGTVTGQTPAFSKPSGYVTQTLEANTFNLVGITLQNAATNSGSFETVAGTLLTDTQGTFAPVVGRTYILEILNDGDPAVNLEGTIQEIPAANITATSITTPDNLQTAGLLPGATFSLSLAPTIEEIFGTTTSVLSKGASGGSATADIVWVPTGVSGGYIRYFIRNSDSTVRNAANLAAAPNVPIVYTDGLLVEKKNTGSSSLVITGQVKTTVAKLVVVPGFNVVGTVFPAGATLQNSGLANSISKGASSGSATADIVWVPSPGNSFTRYFLRSSDSTWRNAATNAAAPADLALTSAVWIQRKVLSNVETNLTPPASYSGL